MTASRSSEQRAAVVLAALIVAFLATIASASPSSAQVGDGATVVLNNLISFEGDPEEINDQDTAIVTSGTEFTGFAGFDIDVSADSVVFSWSDEARFDSFEMQLDGTFIEIYALTISDGEFTQASAVSGSLNPDVEVAGDTLRVIFGTGDIYGDGQEATINFTWVSNNPTPTPTPTVSDTNGTSDTTDTQTTPTATPSPTPTPAEGDFSALRDTLSAGPEGAAGYFAAPNPIPAPTATASQTNDAVNPGLAATGSNSLPLSSIAFTLFAAGAATIVGARRSAVTDTPA